MTISASPIPGNRMDMTRALSIYEDIQKSRLTSLRDQLVESAICYARIRVDWFQADGAGRREMDNRRTRAHNALIDACNILSRNMAKQGEDISWREQLGADRKVIGDFACFLHCLLGVRAR